MVVFIDISDIEDEAINYFVDEQNQSVKTNANANHRQKDINLKTKFRDFLKLNFNITYTFIKYIDDNSIDDNFNFIDQIASQKYIRDKWTIDENIRKKYQVGIQKNIYYMGLLKKLLDENDIKLTVVVYPWFTQIYHNDLESIQVKIWEEFSRKNGNQFINLFPVFINNNNEDLSVQDKILKNFIPYDIHWNKNGSKVVFENFIKNFNLDYKN